ncbi:MAG: NAD-dependent epimerase/dehydratase family protein [Myxococcota bacterium]
MPASDAPILVTGAAGHLGANLVHELVGRGERVRVLLRAEENNEAVDGLDVERAFGDLRDASSLKIAVDGCRQVFHVASMVSTLDGDSAHKRTIYDTNVMGTRHLLHAAQRANVDRFVLTSSFSAVGYDQDRTDLPSDETNQFFPFIQAMPYERTKVLQEHELLKAVAENGMDALIVTSCAIVGGHDYLPSRMGRTLCKMANREQRAYVDGGFEFVAARDIVAGHLLAMERGRKGHKYIVATQFMTLDDIFDILEEITGQPRPKYRIPTKALLPVAEVVSRALYALNPSFPQLLTPGAIRKLRPRRHADTSKARRELGFRPSSLEEAFREAYAFHWKRGAITHPGAKRPKVAAASKTTVSPTSIPIHA